MCEGCPGCARDTLGVQGMPWACEGCPGCARDAPGMRGMLPVCTVPMGARGCAVPRVARARWSLLQGPPRQPQGCVSKPGTPRASGWRELRGEPETPGLERPQSPPVPRGRGISA